LVEGKVVFAVLVASVTLTILSVILGLRYLDDTLGGSDTGSSVLLTLIAVLVLFAMFYFARRSSTNATAFA
jgi:hypothetical protein